MWKKCVVQNVNQLLHLCHLLQSSLWTIFQKPHVISNRHLTEGTEASDAGLKGFLWFHVPATQGGYGPLTSLLTLLASGSKALRKHCDWSAY